jgi:superfamily II DNA or RNA helicase
MTLRPPQAALQSLCLQILDGLAVRQIIAAVAPGGGKSKLPVILASVLVPRFADAVLWVVPRNSLKEQGEAEFLDPRMPTPRRMRAAQGNEPDPTRGTDGYITTYQAIGSSPAAHLEFVRSRRVVVVCDEGHHVADDATWGDDLRPIREAAALVVDMSGTLSRHDGRAIHGMEYDGDLVDLKDRPGVRVIRYSRGDALRDGNILPVELVTIDGAAEWISKEGIHRRVESIRRSGESRADAVFTALRTEFAFQVIRATLDHWEGHRVEYSAARVLVVAPDIETAETYRDFIARTHHVEIATSDDGPAAARAIRDFKRGGVSVLVTVGMAYEGLSVPEITHIACLTQIRSKEWLEQMQARGNRCAEGKFQAWCFAPADKALLDAWDAIDREALTPLGEEQGFGGGSESSLLAEGEGFGLKPASVQPLWSTAHGVESGELDFRPAPVAPSVGEAQLRKNIRDMRVVVVDQARPGSRQAYATVWNKTVRSVVDKDLDHMGTDELVAVWTKLREAFRGRW